jgi:hypothetical protein
MAARRDVFDETRCRETPICKAATLRGCEEAGFGVEIPLD